MSLREEGELVSKMESLVIIPASITIIPDLYHQGSGVVELTSPPSDEPSAQSSYYVTTSWRVLAPLEVDLQTSWNAGEGVYHWYRVEGECGPVTCDRINVRHGDCGRMTFVTMISARSLDELCDAMSNPRFNAPVDLKVTKIHRHSRPVFKNQAEPDQCNELQQVEFCHIPECMKFCEERPSGSSLLNSVLEAAESAPAQEPEVDVSAAAHDDGVLIAGASMSAEAFGLGYEYDSEASLPVVEPPAEVIAICGCSNAGLSISARHSLNRSAALARFLGSNGLSLPESLDLLYKSAESSWSHMSHLRGPNEYWTLLLEVACQTDLWRVSLCVRSGSSRTRLVVDVPAEIACRSAGPSGRMECYFDRTAQEVGSGRRIQVVSPPRAERFSAASAAEIYFEGIFVPHTVYYDELGIFADAFWDYSPLEISLNTVARNTSAVISLDGII